MSVSEKETLRAILHDWDLIQVVGGSLLLPVVEKALAPWQCFTENRTLPFNFGGLPQPSGTRF